MVAATPRRRDLRWARGDGVRTDQSEACCARQAARGGAARESAALLEGDCGGAVQRGRATSRGGVVGCGSVMVPGGGRHAPSDACASGKAALWPAPLLRGPGADRAVARAGPWRARDRPSAGAIGVEDFTGAAALRPGPAGWRGCQPRQSCGSRAGRVLEGPAARAPAASAMGQGLEPGADCPSPAAPLSGRCASATRLSARHCTYKARGRCAGS